MRLLLVFLKVKILLLTHIILITTWKWYGDPGHVQRKLTTFGIVSFTILLMYVIKFWEVNSLFVFMKYLYNEISLSILVVFTKKWIYILTQQKFFPAVGMFSFNVLVIFYY